MFTGIAGATGVAHLGYNWPLIGIDDANIFFVYGRNLADGHGLVYNVPGERVEGFSSISWTLLVAAAHAMFERVEWPLLAVNVLVVSATITALISYADRHWRLTAEAASLQWPTFAGWLLFGWILCQPGFVSWTTLSLMETGLWTSLLIALTLWLLGDLAQRNQGRRILALTCGLPLLILTRPEAPLWAVAFLTLYTLGRIRVDTISRLALAWVPTALTIAGVTLWRLWYFGYPLPNTYYAKVSPDVLYNLQQGMRYLILFVFDHGWLPICLAATMLGLALFLRTLLKREPVRPEAALCCIIGLGLAIPVVEGGDHFSQYRFYQPLWPLLPLPVFAAFGWLSDRVRTEEIQQWMFRFRMPLLLVLVLSFSASSATKWFRLRDAPFAGEIHIAHRGRNTGDRLNQLFAEDPPDVGVLMAGGIRYGYNGGVIDLLGLNHAGMAHAPGDRRGIKGHAAFNRTIFDELAPALLLPRAAASVPTTNPYLDTWYDVPLQGLLQDEAFLQRYQAAHVRHTEQPTGGVYGWVRRDLLRDLTQSPTWVATPLD